MSSVKLGPVLAKAFLELVRRHMSHNTLQQHDLGWDASPVIALGLHLSVHLNLRPLSQRLLLQRPGFEVRK